MHEKVHLYSYTHLNPLKIHIKNKQNLLKVLLKFLQQEKIKIKSDFP